MRCVSVIQPCTGSVIYIGLLSSIKYPISSQTLPFLYVPGRYLPLLNESRCQTIPETTSEFFFSANPTFFDARIQVLSRISLYNVFRYISVRLPSYVLLELKM